MKDNDTSHLSWDEWDELRRPPAKSVGFDQVVAEAISRRGFMGGVLAFGSGAAAMGTGLVGGAAARAQGASGFNFTPIDIATDFDVHVPEGHDWGVLISWGDPIFPGVPPFDHTGGGDAADSDKVFGENTDGMFLFEIDGRQVIAVNHEYTNNDINLPNAPAESAGVANSAEDVRKLQNLHGVTVMEVAEAEDGSWQVVLDSPLNRRIHTNTEMRIAGPAAGHAMMQTSADPDGTTVYGTINNCGSGPTPWGTYLTCEENFNGYFGSSDPDIPLEAGWERYGIGPDESRYNYESFDARFDLAQNPNEPNRFGWVVEIDPADPNSTPVKRTALGRFKHENAAVAIANDGRAVVYMGDDERGEFTYRFVSSGTYQEGGDNSTLLDEGTLYAGKFNPDGTGEWLALTPESTGMEDLATVLIFARDAGSAVGATTMDRPEWVQVSPVAAEVYCSLTNNSNREVGATNAGGDAMEPQEDGPNPRATNDYGQIVRWRPDGDDHGSDTFTWDLYVMAGNPEVYGDNEYGGSDNITPGNMFNSPDGMGIDSNGMVWIQTDGDDSNEGDFAGMGNNQMLVGNPQTGEIARFMTGPNGSEVTGLTWSADRLTAFVGIQHPGGSWPGEGPLPRSSIIWIRRQDGQPIG